LRYIRLTLFAGQARQTTGKQTCTEIGEGRKRKAVERRRLRLGLAAAQERGDREDDWRRL
jgi:hypothetical protein